MSTRRSISHSPQYEGSGATCPLDRVRFEPQVVERELAIIRDDLHCNAIQVVDGDLGRLEQAARYAAELGWRCGSHPPRSS